MLVMLALCVLPSGYPARRIPSQGSLVVSAGMRPPFDLAHPSEAFSLRRPLLAPPFLGGFWPGCRFSAALRPFSFLILKDLFGRWWQLARASALGLEVFSRLSPAQGFIPVGRWGCRLSLLPGPPLAPTVRLSHCAGPAAVLPWLELCLSCELLSHVRMSCSCFRLACCLPCQLGN